MGFKENWEKVDKTCPNCGQVTERVKGLTRQNVKRLFSFKMNYTEFLITFMLIMILFLAFVYKDETKVCREWLTDIFGMTKEQCKMNCDYRCDLAKGIYNKTEITNTTEIFVKLNLSLSP